MFWTEEDIQPAVAAVESVFGRQGQYQPTPFVYVSIETSKYGTVWYGDVSGTIADVVSKAASLAGKVYDNMTVRDLGTSTVLYNTQPQRS